MKISNRGVSVGTREALFLTSLNFLLVLGSCGSPQNSTPEAFQTKTPEASQLDLLRQRAIDFIAHNNEKSLGDQMASFSVNFPKNENTGQGQQTMSGTIFEIKSNLPDDLPLTLAVYIPDDVSENPVPVILNHVSSESLARGEIDVDGVPTTMYGVGALPMDEASFQQIIDGGLILTPGSFDRYLKKDKDGNIIPLYTLWFKDLNPENVNQFILQFSQEKDPKKQQQLLLNHVHGVTFNDVDSDRSLTIEFDVNKPNQLLEFIVSTFFAPNMVAHAAPAETPLPPSTPIPELPVPVIPSLPPEALTWVETQKAADPEFVLPVVIDADGFHVNLGVDEDTGIEKIINVPAEQIATRIKVGQEGALQVYSETGDKIIAVFDPETNKWIDRDKVVAKDFFNMETYIHVQTWEQVKELWRLEQHFMIPFPEDTQFPVFDEKQADYQARLLEGFYSPLGNPPPGKEPVIPFNGIILDKGVDVEVDYAFGTQQVFNRADKTFSSWRVSRTADSYKKTILQHLRSIRYYILPSYQTSSQDNLDKLKSNFPFIFKIWEDAGLYKGEGLEYTGIKKLVLQWLISGDFPEELRYVPMFPYFLDYF